MSGHVFVVHGDLLQMNFDAALLPMGAGGHLVDPWAGYLRDHDVRPPVPDGQESHTGAVDVDGAQIRFVVSGYAGATAAGIGDRLSSALSGLTDASVGTDRSRRSRPLVAVPLLGVRAGGLAGQHGEILQVMLDALHAHAHASDVDIALVCWSRAAYAAAQQLRRRSQVLPDASDVQLDLAGRVRAGQLTLFVGAGPSAAAGLPDWASLLHALAQQASQDRQPAPWLDGFDQLPLVDRATLLSKVLADDSGETLNRLVVQHLASTVSGHTPVPSLQHWLLASLAVPETATTNFDLLLDQALAHTSYPDPVRVLPWDPVSVGDRWLLKLHGDVDRGQITLSRDDFLGYDTLRRPLASVVQAQLLTRHMLLVGYSLDDDNFIRLARDVQAMVSRLSPDPERRELATALMPWPQPARERLWGGALRFAAASPEPADSASFRAVEIWLDTLAAHAVADTPYLLDPDFRGMLTRDDTRLADALLQLRGLADGTAAEGRIASLLHALGDRVGRQDHATLPRRSKAEARRPGH